MPARAAAERIPRDLRIHVRVAVDEARRDDQPVSVERARRRRRDLADLDDAAILDADVTVKRALPEPSTTVPPRMTVSNAMTSSC